MQGCPFLGLPLCSAGASSARNVSFLRDLSLLHLLALCSLLPACIRANHPIRAGHKQALLWDFVPYRRPALGGGKAYLLGPAHWALPVVTRTDVGGA
jgi:hypothetical protein